MSIDWLCFNQAAFWVSDANVNLTSENFCDLFLQKFLEGDLTIFPDCDNPKQENPELFLFIHKAPSRRANAPIGDPNAFREQSAFYPLTRQLLVQRLAAFGYLPSRIGYIPHEENWWHKLKLSEERVKQKICKKIADLVLVKGLKNGPDQNTLTHYDFLHFAVITKTALCRLVIKSGLNIPPRLLDFFTDNQNNHGRRDPKFRRKVSSAFFDLIEYRVIDISEQKPAEIARIVARYMDIEKNDRTIRGYIKDEINDLKKKRRT